MKKNPGHPRRVMPAALACLVLALCGAHAATLRIPAYTAYVEPDPDGLRISSRTGLISGWQNPELKVLWFGQFKTPGELQVHVALRLPEGRTSRLRLTLAGRSAEATVTGQGTNTLRADFGRFSIPTNGYYRFTLESGNAQGTAAGDIEALELDGPSVAGAHFNLKSRRNAASVHWFYTVPKEVQVEAFYCEMTGLEDPVTTYYMACGWHRGYFGMQVNSRNERRIIFSVWDSGNEAVDRAKVPEENRVQLVAKGQDVYAGDFGNEGTGGHSHLKYLWKTGEKQRFIVTAKPVAPQQTIFSGYYFHPEKKEWILISSWRAPKEGGYLRGLYSFSENFGGSTGHLVRKALYGNQWIRTPQGQWLELTQARFSHDSTGKADRLDRFGGIEQGQFFLCHGGFLPGFTAYGETFQRPTVGRPPTDLQLPPLPE
ncbi:MAG: DUF3472 domain-containing protein [Verrucomicrobiae bacterium]|nr:DUF3472 domain-containing protein [Verrucomicrobiae bacterium]